MESIYIVVKRISEKIIFSLGVLFSGKMIITERIIIFCIGYVLGRHA